MSRPRKDRDVERELQNWRRAHSDAWLDSHLGIAPSPTFEQHVAGLGYDESENQNPTIDEILADKTEAVVVRIGAIEPDIYEVMVGFWPKRRSAELIARDMGRSVQYVKACLVAGERMYKKMRKKANQAT